MSSFRKNIVVTGGAGFIGSHLCDALVKEANVICIDNFITSSVQNIEHLLQNSSFEFINHDINEPIDLSKYRELERFHINVHGVQEIYHLACPISKRQFEQFRVATLLTNSLGIKSVLDLALQSKAKILYASSSVLYGPKRPDEQFIPETADSRIDHLTPHGAYDEGKRFSEAMVYTYADVYGLDVKIARLFRTYGPRMKINDGNILPDMINQALDGEDIVLHTDDHARMSLCYVSDMVDGLIKHMNASMDVRVMNLGSDQEYPLAEVADKIVRLSGSLSRVRFDPDRAARFESGLPDIAQARHALHWVPLVRLEDGLFKMIEYARSRRQLLTAF